MTYSDACSPSYDPGYNDYGSGSVHTDSCDNFTNASECGGNYHVDQTAGCHNNVIFSNWNNHSNTAFENWPNWSNTNHGDTAFGNWPNHSNTAFVNTHCNQNVPAHNNTVGGHTECIYYPSYSFCQSNSLCGTPWCHVNPDGGYYSAGYYGHSQSPGTFTNTAHGDCNTHSDVAFQDFSDHSNTAFVNIPFSDWPNHSDTAFVNFQNNVHTPHLDFCNHSNIYSDPCGG